MVERFEEGLGKYTYITLPQVKDYLTISSNTYDARISNIISYATSVVEHYIGQEVLANNYVELFDGGSAAVQVSRLPLNNVYQVTEYNGTTHTILADATTIGTSVVSDSDTLTVSINNNARINTRIKKFGKASLSLDTNDLLVSTTVPDSLRFEEGDFTIEAMVRVDEATIQDNTIFSINTDASNYMAFKLANQVGLAFTSNIAGSATTIQGANSLVESQQFIKRRWAHVAVSRNLEEDMLYMHYNGNVVANASYSESNLTFTSNVLIGSTFKGYIDELRVSDTARYSVDFTPPTRRFRPDDDTVSLFHFDTNITDSHNSASDYTYSRDTGSVKKHPNSNPNLPVSSIGSFLPYNSGVKVSYRAGYEEGDVPYDIQLATLDYIKILYKQTQATKGFTFEGEQGSAFPLSANFPAHIRRILDLYRIIF